MNINWGELEGLVSEEIRPSATPLFKKWLERGDGVAVYENMAFDSGNFGHKKFVSFGSDSAQLEVEEPPQRLPDIGGQINWAYQLVATHRKVTGE